MLERLLRISALILIAGCAGPATGPEFKLAGVSPDRGNVYVYRPDREFNRGGYANVFVNGEKRFALKESGYALLVLQPGSYEFKFEGSQATTNWWPPVATRTLGVEPGREYFIRAIPALPPGAKPGPYLFANNISRTLIDLVPKAQALPEITGLRSVED